MVKDCEFKGEGVKIVLESLLSYYTLCTLKSPLYLLLILKHKIF